MNGNSPEYCPVCYTSIKANRDHRDRAPLPGGACRPLLRDWRSSDVLLHHGTSIQLFRDNGRKIHAHASVASSGFPGSWQFQANDQIVVGDFNGDGADEVVIFNGVDWAFPTSACSCRMGRRG